jgi:methionyl-tRNA formyltransferase
MQIIFFGTPQFAVPTLERLLAQPELEVLAVVTQPDKKRGRGNDLIPSPIKKIAIEHNIPVWQPKSVKKNRETLNKLKESAADTFVVVAYGQILSKEILEMPKLGCINVHGSILPKYRGAAPIQWSIYHGDRETGITTMLMNEGMDTGDMLLKAYTPIALLDNAWDIAATLSKVGADLAIETLEKMQANKIRPLAQNDLDATYARPIHKFDYDLDWSYPAIEIHNKVRGFFPNCVTTFQGKSLKVMATVPIGEAYFSELPLELQKIQTHWQDLSSLTGKPGEVVSILKNFGAIVQTGAGLILLKEVQLAGKRPQSGWDFVNGMRLSTGEILA